MTNFFNKEMNGLGTKIRLRTTTPPMRIWDGLTVRAYNSEGPWQAGIGMWKLNPHSVDIDALHQLGMVKLHV